VILLFDIGNTNTHVGLADARRVVRQTDIPTTSWFNGTAPARPRSLLANQNRRGGAVVRATPCIQRTEKFRGLACPELIAETARELITQNQTRLGQTATTLSPRDIVSVRLSWLDSARR
jgi:hypothetical protein